MNTSAVPASLGGIQIGIVEKETSMAIQKEKSEALFL